VSAAVTNSKKRACSCSNVLTNIMIRQQEESRKKAIYEHHPRDEKGDHDQQAVALNKPCGPSARYGDKETNDG
jgi:hypothetical protein